MNTEPFFQKTSMTTYHAKRTAWLVIGIMAILGVKPAFALFSSGPENQTITITAAAPAGDSIASLASAATVGFDDGLPTDESFPEINVVAAMAKELGSASPIFVYRPTARWPLASITKLMTATLALEELGPGTILTVSKSAVETEGTAGGLVAGDKYSVIDLARAILTVSSNDAAIALAEGYDAKQLTKEAYDLAPSKVALFTAAMQEKARSLGMSQTYYGDPSGLSVINQSIATDLETLINYLDANHPEILEITRKKESTILERKSMTRRTLTNINQFAGQPDFFGGKTGFTDQAGGNLLSIFNYEGKRYLIIVLGTEDRFGETQKIYDWIKERAIADQSATR